MFYDVNSPGGKSAGGEVVITDNQRKSIRVRLLGDNIESPIDMHPRDFQTARRLDHWFLNIYNKHIAEIAVDLHNYFIQIAS